MEGWASAVFVDLSNLAVPIRNMVIRRSRPGPTFEEGVPREKTLHDHLIDLYLSRDERWELLCKRVLWAGRQVAPEVRVVSYRAGPANEALLVQARGVTKRYLRQAKNSRDLVEIHANTSLSARVVRGRSEFEGHVVDNALISEVARVVETCPKVQDYVIFSGDRAFEDAAKRLHGIGKRVHVISGFIQLAYWLYNEADSVNYLDEIMSFRAFRYDKPDEYRGRLRTTAS